MILKVVLLLAYFLLIFIGARIFEFYATSVAGWKCFNDIIPAILDNLHEKPQEKQDKAFDEYNEESNYDHNFSEEDVESEIDSCHNVHRVADNDVEIEDLQIINFNSYREFEDNVEYTTSIWLVQVNTSKKKHVFNKRQWNWMSRRLKKIGIKMGIYTCSVDQRLCINRKIYSSTFILATPRGYQVNVDFHIFQTDTEMEECVIFNWIKSKLNPKVKTVHSLSELTERPISRLRYKNVLSKPSMFFIYKSNERVAPLLLTSLSVKFTGRIKFYMFKTKEASKSGNVFAMNPNTMYNYGEKRGEDFTYSCVEFFLRTLHPEVNDIFMVSVILLNMACWLELFLQKGGPLKRLFYYVWGFAIANIFLVSIWLLLIQLLYMPQVQPIIDLCLKNFQQVMFTNIASIIRQDITQLSKHLHIVILGFVGYGVLLGILHCKLRRRTDSIFFTSVMDLVRYDIEELRELFYSLIGYITPSLRIYRFEEGIERILRRLAAPDLWLHSKYPTDYIHSLPTWTYYCNELDCLERNHVDSMSDEDIQSDGDTPSVLALKNYSLFSLTDDKNGSQYDSTKNLTNEMDECVICLDVYKCGVIMRGLPCGHCFHKICIDSWLLPNNEASHHMCPVCRWPADIKKGEVEVVDLT